MEIDQLTIISVLGPNDGPYWDITAELLLQHLPDTNVFFHLVDNYQTLTKTTATQTTVYRQDSLRFENSLVTRGSIEHSRCLNHVLSQLGSDAGLVAIIDPDFFVIDGKTLRHFIHKIRTSDRMMLGTTWHRQWVTKSQDWIAPHFVLFDAAKIAPNLLDFSTGFGVESGGSRRTHHLTPLHSTVDLAYRLTLGRFRSGSSPDTGYMVAEHVRSVGGQVHLLPPRPGRRPPYVLGQLMQANSIQPELARIFLKSAQKSEFFEDSGVLWAMHLRKQAQLNAAPPVSLLRNVLRSISDV